MPQYRITLERLATITVRIKHDGGPGEALEFILDEGIPDICAQCSGYGQYPGWEGDWAREEDDHLTEVKVEDKGGNVLWTGPTSADQSAARELETMADLFVDTMPDAAVLLRDRAAALMGGEVAHHA